MKKGFSFTRLLYNDKLMLVLSLIISVSIWFGVISDSANIEERSIPVTVTVDLTNSYAYQSGLRVIGEDTFTAQVNVSGAWSVITKLDESDFRVRPDLTAITGAGDVDLPLNVKRNSAETDYDIVSVTPSEISVVCDYWQEGARFRVQTDVSALKAKEFDKYQIGEPVLDKTAFPDGMLTLSGPKTTVSQIDQLVAKVATEEELTETKQLDVPLSALDKNGAAVDISACEIKEVPNKTVAMTVPLWEERIVPLQYTVVHAPKAMKDRLSAEPREVDLLGPAEELDALEERFKNLGTVDFAKLSMSNNSVTFALDIPATVRAIDSPEALTVTLDVEGLAQKAVTLEAKTANTTVKGKLGSLKADIPSQKLEGIVLIGDESAINAITEAALSLEIDVGDEPTPGTKQYLATVKVNGRDDVWVYYSSQNGAVPLYATLS